MIEIVTEDKIRIDKYLTEKTDLSRSKIQKLIDEGKILVNGNEVSSNYKVKLNDKIEIKEEDMDFSIDIVKENIPLDIVYEDEYLLVINKKSGMVTHPAPGNYTGTLVNALLYKFDLEGDPIRPGIVHRLDKDTSGLMVVAKNEKVHDLLASMIKDKKVERHYLALVEGVIPHETGTIDAPIGRDIYNRQKMAVTDVNGKDSITHFKVLKRYKDKTLVECVLETGRTHQIRVHMAYIKHPVVNDPLYNKKKADSFGQMLHSKSIKFTHPITGKEIYYEAEPPKEFMEKLEMVEE
ncbi:MAG: RluA family pseudouridine synthase [bacterium]|nr:RluA family pseudouridine synthase [bacterium]